MKRILFFAVLIGSIFIINGLVRSIYGLWQKQGYLATAQKQLEKEKSENSRLKKQLAEVQSPKFLEEQARNKLLLIKEGEQEVIIPKEFLGASDSAKGKERDSRSNWQKWWDLFF
ncbi:MAG: septum formation initiator family protein [Patescibacteria group bacterium]|nr:septum formation initiator family protein [Patescibacteria group bacterium]